MQKHHWIISKKHMYMLFFLRPSLSLCRLCTYTPGLLPAKRTLIRMTPGGPNQRRWGFHTSAHSQRRRLSWIRWTLQAFFSLWCQSVGVISGMWPGVNPSCHLFDIYIYTYNDIYMIYMYIYICIYICIWCVYIYIYIYIYMYMMCIYIYICIYLAPSYPNSQKIPIPWIHRTPDLSLWTHCFPNLLPCVWHVSHLWIDWLLWEDLSAQFLNCLAPCRCLVLFLKCYGAWMS